MKKRRQLTLFVSPEDSGNIENIRRKYNPIQYELIKSHVTLCREDEIEQSDKVIENLRKLTHHPVTIRFGSIMRFSDGKGLLIPADGENAPFNELRREVLRGIIRNPKKVEAHITLMHPRNSTCTDSIYAHISKSKFSESLVFRKVSLIEQEDGGKWEVLEEFELNSDND